MNYAIILAGGAGTRFWPLSRLDAPKQFLELYSEKPMLAQTINRIGRLIKRSNICIATNKIYQKNIKDCLRTLHIPAKNVFFEPESRNTLAPIGVLSKDIYHKDREAVILVLPSDHYIKDTQRFLKALEKAIAQAKKGYILTLGITPNRPETGYGYIKISSKFSRKNGIPTLSGKVQSSKLYKVKKFIEKPSILRAEKFIRDKKYYWNSGIFIFRADVILEEIENFLPKAYRIIRKIKDKKSLNKLWHRLPSVSIDYAIMEKTKKIALIPVDFGWMDLGSWQAIDCFAKKDRYGNIFQGHCLDIGSKNTLGWSDNRLLATIGLDNIIIVNTKDAVLVCAKDKSQDVKKMVQLLKQKKLYKQI